MIFCADMRFKGNLDL